MSKFVAYTGDKLIKNMYFCINLRIMDNFKRYTPQIRVKEIGDEGQKLLHKSHVLIVGCGALGSPLSMYLAGAGVGNITVADFDTVDLSNLHRQVFFCEEELGAGKAERLRNKLLLLNSDITVDYLSELVSDKNLNDFMSVDLVLDAADNPATTYTLDNFCYRHGIPFVTAGVSDWRAQIFTYVPGSSSYADIFPRPADGNEILPCSIAGIVGPVAAFAASIQAIEAIKLLTGNAATVSRLITANLLTGDFSTASC